MFSGCLMNLYTVFFHFKQRAGVVGIDITPKEQTGESKP